MSATALAGALRAGHVTAREVAAAHLEAIARLDATLNAMITVDAGAANRAADALDALPAEERGPLHGVPVVIKDLTDTRGLRTTYGSALFADHVPAEDDLVVARLRAAGAVILGKSNTPEFGFGALCQNALCGPTRNPYDPALTSGGSSGGSAVAVAAGMAPLAHGTDFGGSLRTPAGFCGVVSIRPTPGRIPSPARGLAWDTLATHGVMARSVDDCMLMLAAVAGPDRRDPTSLRIPDEPESGSPRVSATVNFGVAPVSRTVRARFDRALGAMQQALERPVRLGAPDCQGAIASFKTLRAAHVRHAYGGLRDRFGEGLSPTAAWNIAAGDGLTAQDYLAAEAARSAVSRRFAAFFEATDVLVAPAASVMPWPNTQADVLEIDGQALDSIVDYLAVTFLVSLVGYPVLTVPAPRGDGETPFGVQLIGRPGAERTLAALGRRLEAAGFTYRPPSPEIA
ncbi:amidase [Alsobacter sp. KACC 23698]|uniref:Indoleacetamide hydrolase n=1 Tax=Alsobacter sp. KACC 23698 TaxID=3149229 RepID=A0AAU7JES2_9HYPH